MDQRQRRKELPQELRKKIIDKYVTGQGYKTISKQLDVPVTTVAQLFRNEDLSFCAVKNITFYSVGYAYLDIWGPGTQVAVTAESVTKPNVFPLKACEKETSENVAIGCLASGYIPGPVTFEWSGGAKTSAAKEITTQSNGIYVTSSFLTIPRSSLNKETFICTVKHEPSKSEISKEIKDFTKVTESPRDTPDSVNKTSVYAFCPHDSEMKEVKRNSKLSLVCMIKSPNIEDVNISWWSNKKMVNTKQITVKENLTKFIVLSISKEHWENKKIYHCKSKEGDVEDVVSKDKCQCN
ncbi:immunoglobulin gamma-1 heavy chain-like [Leptodactylus fuscus]